MLSMCARKGMWFCAWGLAAWMIPLGELLAASLPAGLSESSIAGPIARGTRMAFAPDGTLLVLSQGGSISVFAGSGSDPWTSIATGGDFLAPLSLSIDSAGERGLLGIAIDPNYAVNRLVYLYYTASQPSPHNRISRVTADANGTLALAGSEAVIMDLDDLSSSTNHNGGAIQFGPDGKLYVGVGDNASSVNAQSPASRLGKILRLNPNPLQPVPSDNPPAIDGFDVGSTGTLRAVWAAGLRNPFSLAFKPGSSLMYINDVGENTYEEINVGIAAANYGWPETEGPFDAQQFPPFRQPIAWYHHANPNLSSPAASGDFRGVCITGSTFYVPAVQALPVQYNGSYFFGDFVSGWIRRYDPQQQVVMDFASDIAGPVDVQVGPDGALYYLARNADGPGQGRVFRIVASASAVCVGDIWPQIPGNRPGGASSGNRIVDIDDLLAVINNWGQTNSFADISGNGVVDIDDLLLVITHWGRC